MQLTDRKPAQSFTDLSVWKEGHCLVLMIYNCTKYFPMEERFGLTNQLRRAAVSITSNIAEGFSRKSPKEKIQFYSTALGSLSEVQNQMLIARDVRYIDQEKFEKIANQSITISKLLSVFIKTTKTTFQIQNSRF